MTNFKTLAAMAVATAALLGAAQAQAHAKLVSADPAQDSTVAAPKQLVLTFSEKLQAKFSGLVLTMPGMNDMTVPTKVAVAKDGMTMTATPAKPLPQGAYTVSWHAVTADTHRVEGKYNFTVR
ncbi:MAG TPA: copper homeostasis periplasmic binding protein CopC [Phenylobacterium sp.]|nr:copper homeostasis periplasmic binding protein CopC [Phenylobacterium sp.]